jgi:broad specificity phosphatase PhoE
MSRSIRPLSVAVTNFLNRSLRTPEEIAQLIGVDVSVVFNWFEGEGFPHDDQMSTILRDFERTSGSSRTPHMPNVLTQFWDELRAIEESKEDFWELELEDGERVSARLTRFTNYGWMENLVNNIHLVHPSRRRALDEAMIETFNRFTDD